MKPSVRPASRAKESRGLALAADLSVVVLAWVVALLVEDVVVGALWGVEFSAAWETTRARRLVAPIALAGLAPCAFVIVGWWRVARLAARGSRLARYAWGALGFASGMVVALGVSHGRHFASLGVRAAFVGIVAGALGAVSLDFVPRIARWLAPRGPATIATGLALGVGAWVLDVSVLPRLYPSFHGALLVASLVGFGLLGLGMRATRDVPARAWAVVSVLAGLVWLGCVAWTPAAVRRLDPLANLRRVLAEHAPYLGEAVELSVLTRGPAPEPEAPEAKPVAPGEVARSLDWTGHDIVLLSVDALRADHVSAYGYGRPTTPNIDGLAAQGAMFTAAYCPTPHTSYSVTSMMTGKYLRPLLALGLGEDSETWAQDLRTYGWRTAAFYPPAVFFIDEDRFPRFEKEALGFEYSKVEFADPALREQQVTAYLHDAPKDKPLFLWVHFFEPHEPYVPHPDHVFSGGASPDVDAYDGEVATADDGIGRVVKAVQAARPGAVVIVTADHGEEFGEHGGRYHGTTVYEEQVRVPLVVVGPGVHPGAKIASVVQTVDLLPTALSALGLPRPARLRGRDLGPLLAGTADDPGFAFVETDDYDLVASGSDRLVCQRRAAACAIYDLGTDPGEHKESGNDAREAELHAQLRGVERDTGKFETAAGPAWPEALRRGIVGDADAAIDVAALLDDANVGIRRKAAEVEYALRVPETIPALKRAAAQDEDDEVRRWATLALVRAGDAPSPAVEAMLRDPSKDWKRRAALALGERGSPKACETLDAWWNELAPAPARADPDGEPPQIALDLGHVRDLLAATGKAKCKGAVPALIAALADVRARPYVADALAAIGDERGRPPLLALLGSEPYVTTRPHEAEAVLSLIPATVLVPPLLPDATGTVKCQRKTPGPNVRLVVLLSDANATLDATVDGHPVDPAPVDGTVRQMAVPAGRGEWVKVALKPGSGTIRGVWLAPTAALD
jgi:hypothetical protein